MRPICAASEPLHESGASSVSAGCWDADRVTPPGQIAACYSMFLTLVPSGILIWNWSSVSVMFSFKFSTVRTS